MKTKITLLLFLTFSLITLNQVSGQSNCGGNVPTFTVDLTGSPDSAWISPDVQRLDLCCDNKNPDKCVQFLLTLDSAAQGIKFDVCDGATPGGALFYRVNCGPEVAVGTPICLGSVGPHSITFCKPGDNVNKYCITSIGRPTAPMAITLNDGCTGTLGTTGFEEATIVWNSISPGNVGDYNSYLSCTVACDTIDITAQPGYPPSVDIQVCGVPLGGCITNLVCKTTTVNFNPTLFADIQPVNATVCFGASGTTITANPWGGTPPYTYTWNTGATTQSIFVTAGTYSVVIEDATDCPPVTASIIVTEFATAIDANAGPDQTVCAVSPAVTLSGSVTAATGGVWTGGSGTYSPDNTSLTATYTPSAAEIAAGSVTLTLTTTGNGTCPADSDIMVINIVPFQGTIAMSKTDITCNGGTDGTATATITGTAGPYTYSWNSSPVQTTSTATNLPVGTYTVSLADSNGCPAQDTISIFEPLPLTSTTTQKNVSCYLGSDGTATVTAYGGNGGYSYSWSTGATTATISNLAAGTYTVTITDAKGCTTTNSVAITQPTIISAIISSKGNVSCNGGNDGTATVTATGGTPSYTYLWSPTGGTGPTATGLPANTYTITVTDQNGCQAIANNVIIEPANGVNVTISQTNVSCFGGSNGSATATASGGTSPYTYAWSTGSTSSTVTGLAAGTYTLTVTDDNDCPLENVVTITEPAALATTVSVVNTVCDLPTGQANIGVTGGVSPYTYLWSTGDTTASIAGVMAGTYTVTVTDINGCTKTDAAVIINNNPQVFADINSSTNVFCFGGSDGSAMVTASGGTSPYSYQWSSGGTSATETGLPIGTYTVTVTDANTCSKTDSVTITEPPLLTSSIIATTNVSCNALTDGSATVEAAGGTPEYTYTWSPSGGTDSVATGLGANTYTVTVTDANNCTSISSVTITQPDLLVITATPADVTCNGGSDGSITTSTSGGTPGYTYSWSPAGGTNNDASGLTAGTYTVTVTDNNGCTASATVTVNEPPALTVFTTQTNVKCKNGSDGSATVNVSGGTAPYTYLWSNSITDSTITGLTVGTYTVTVTDANSCTATASATITEPDLLVSTITGTNVSCFGGDDGTATVTVTGGTTSYTYNWTPYGGSSPIATGLVADTYTVAVTDANGCATSSTITINEPAAPLTGVMSKTDVSCFGGADGTATVSASGGTSGYTYLWSAPSGATTATATGLIAGNYSVTVTDAKGCLIILTVTITQPPLLTVAITNSENVSCFGGTDGMAAASVSGGTPGYTYDWSPFGSGNSPISENLEARTYVVTVTDTKGCTASASVNITQPAAPLSVTTTQINNLCYGETDGSATANVSGGTTPYSYKWSPGSMTTATINNLAADTYTVVVTDTNGCTISASVIITEPPAMTFTASVTDATCGQPNGEASITVSGGNPGYTIVWSNGDTGSTADSLASGAHTATVTDASGCTQDTTILLNDIAGPSAVIYSITHVACFGDNSGEATVGQVGGVPPYTYSWNTSPPQTTATATGLYAGVYIATVTDSNGCLGLAITNPEIFQPPPFELQTTQTNVLCNGGNNGSATVTVTGATPGYTYLWPSGSTDSTDVNLTAGTYTVTITDANGCDTTATYIITEPTPLTNTISGTDVQCNSGNDGSASLVVSGGVPFYTYLWNTGATSADLTGIIAGTYTVTATDRNACTTSASIVINEPSDEITATTSKTNVSCFGGSDGTATVTPSGGTPPFTYAWSSGDTDSTAVNLIAGNYFVTVSDANLCEYITTVTVTQPPLLTAGITGSTNVSCFGGNNGSVTVGVSGGTPGYTYLWSSGGTSATETGLADGTYTVTVTDTKGCTVTTSVTITQPAAALAATTAQTNVSCFGGSNGSAVVTASGGTTPYTYAWTPAGGINDTATGLPANTYTVTVTDTNGCQATASVIITEPTELTSSITSITNVSCNGLADGSATVTAAGGTVAYDYLWSSGSTNATATGLAAATYVVTVTDANGCTSASSTTITQPAAVAATMSKTNVSCNGGSDGSATITVTGGSGGYSYSWSPAGGTGSTASGLPADIYTVNVVDANGCPFSMTVEITEPVLLTASVTKTDVSCNGGSDGTATAEAFGGVSGYAFLWSTGENTATINNLSIGTYTVTVTDANGCTVEASTTITEPTILAASVTGVDVSCFGGNDGFAEVIASGGTPYYTYSWQPAGGSSSTATSLTAGTYTVTVTDIKGCTTSATIDINEPSAALTASATATDVTCFGGFDGTATVAAAGGTIPYSYLWSPGGATTATATGLQAGNYSVTVTDTNGCLATVTMVTVKQPSLLTVDTTNVINTFCEQVNGSVTAAATGGITPYDFAWSNGDTNVTADSLAAGTYTVTVTDANGCTASVTAQVTDTPGGTADITSVKNVSCKGGEDGEATVTPAGGIPPYIYSWAPAGGTNATGTGLWAGQYVVTVTDSKGCTATDTVVITEPTLLTSSIFTSTNVSCNGVADGTGIAFGMGGTPPYSYSWNSSPVQNNDTATGLPAGSYIVTVTDDLGCTDTSHLTITQPATLVAAIGTFKNTTCYGTANGTATASPSGGTTPYFYSWSTTPAQSTQTATGLAPGTYTVTVTDNNGCTDTVSVLIEEPAPVVTTAISDDTTICETTNAILGASASGGNGGYYFIWDPEPGFDLDTVTVTPLTETVYTVVAYDAFGCPGNPEYITVSVLSLKPENVTAQANSPICPGSSTTLYVTVGGTSTGALDITWSEGSPTNPVIHTGPASFQHTPAAPTTYYVTVINECGVAVTKSVSVDFKPVPTIAIDALPRTGCVPLPVDFIDLSTSTDPIISWLWEFGDGSTSTDSMPHHIYTASGNYGVSLTVTTSGECVTSLRDSAYQVEVYPLPTAAFTPEPATVMLPTQAVNLNNQSQGGTSYYWEFGDGNFSMQESPKHLYGNIGTYTITLTTTSAPEKGSCIDTATATVIATSDLVFPTAFTPNPNGPSGGVYNNESLDNDIFFPYTEGVEDFHLMIFNRWGELIFETRDVNIGWDGYYRGKLCQQDVYVWKVVAKFNDGRSFHKAGDVTLLR